MAASESHSYVTASHSSGCRYNLSLNTMPVPLSAAHERPCQRLIRHFRHHLRPDNLSQAIPHLRAGGTLKDNQIPNATLPNQRSKKIRRLSGRVHKTFGGKKQGSEAGRSNFYSPPFAILQLNCQLSSQLHSETTGERKEEDMYV